MRPPPGRDPALVEAALSIGRDLVSTAVPSGEGCSWLADVVVGVEGGEPAIDRGDVGVTLYDGTAGIALALAACAEAAGPAEAPRFSATARDAARRALEGAPGLLTAGRLGLFDGATGIALGAVTIARSCEDDALLEDGMALARELASCLESPDKDAELDLIGGLAGSVLGLRRIFADGGEAPSLTGAVDRLVGAAVPQTWGAAWPGGADDPPLLGLGHGSAGIALALAESAGSSEDGAARACAEGLEYERGWFDLELVAWPDLREHGLEPADPVAWTAAWCHGAIGIGLSRLRLTRLLDDPVVSVEAAVALQVARSLAIAAGTRLREGETSDCTACHGLAGVAELLLVAAPALDVPDHARAARRVAALMLEQREATGGSWPCGLPGAGEIPALMTGTAGIALTLLRVAGAVETPTPLLPGTAGW